MPNNWTVAITHYDIGTTTETVITENFVSLPKATDTGNEEINSATLVLSAPLGKFITTTPVISQFDRIRIVITDIGTNEYNKVFDVVKIIPSWTKSEGVRVTLALQGMEHHLQKINHVKPFFYEGGSETFEDIVTLYNASKGSTQPTLTSATNSLPNANFSVNNYDFAVNQDSCHNRMLSIIDKLGASVDDGGALDFYDLRFTNSNANFTTLASNVFSSGSPTSGSEVTITETSSVNVGESESGVDSITGTVVHSWGAVDQGSLPIDYSQFKSAQRRFKFYPKWVNTVDYLVNSIVQDGDTVYKCILANGPSGVGAKDPPNATYWTVRTAALDFGEVYTYSPWTQGQAAAWKDGGCDPTNGNSSAEIGQSFWDNNVIVNDTEDSFFRTWVDVRVSASTPDPTDITGSATLSKYLYEGTHFYRGFRVLLQANSAPTGTWAGSDTAGKAFIQSVMECVTAGTATTAVWRVIYEATTDNLVCTVRDEGITYTYATGASTWSAGAMVTDGDHLHPYTSLTNVSGIPNAGDGTYTLNTSSAIQARYDFNSWDSVRSATDDHRCGAWLNFTFPYPAAKINGSSLVGSLYGGSVSSRDSVCEPATFDTQNMHLTHDGYRGFNAPSDSSEDFGQVSSIDFWMNFNYQSEIPAAGFTTVEAANFIITCSLIDTEDNVVSQDFTIKFNNQWDEYKLPISGFNIYRGRKPLESLISSIVIPKELNISNIFRWRNVKQIIFQTKESYDTQGRYAETDLLGNRYIGTVTVAGIPLILKTGRRIDMTIDALHFTKPLLVNTGQDTSRCIENEFIEKPEIMDYHQLKNDAKAELEKRKWQHVEFDITTAGAADINYGDFFIYENSNLIADAFEISSGSNTIQLVAKHIEYSITKPVNGKGGFLRRILGVRRFV